MLRAVYYAGYVWSQSLVPMQILPSPEDWRWKLEDSTYIPEWTDLPDLKKEFVNLGNPFFGDSTDLIQLGTQDVLDMDVVCTVRNIKGLATKQRQDFKQVRFLSQVKSLDDPIKKNKLPLFKSKNTKGQSSRQTESKELKSIFLKSHIRLFPKCTFQIRPGVVIWINFSVMKL